jgi:hypothetical protein
MHTDSLLCITRRIGNALLSAELCVFRGFSGRRMARSSA